MLVKDFGLLHVPGWIFAWAYGRCSRLLGLTFLEWDGIRLMNLLSSSLLSSFVPKLIGLGLFGEKMAVCPLSIG